MTALAFRQDLAAYLAAPQGELPFADLRSDIFDWAYGTQKDAFYRLQEFQAIIFIYQLIRRLASLDPQDIDSYSVAQDQLAASLRNLRQLVAEDGLDKKEFEKAQRDLASLLKKTGLS